MLTIARYSSEFVAQAAAEFLRSEGVAAEVVGGMLAEAPSSRSPGLSGFEVVLLHPAERSRATLLLEEFHLQGPASLADWEDQTLPDLSRLDPALAPPCAACGTLLPLDPHLDQCPACEAPADVLEQLLRVHGPEALALCFDADDPDGAPPGAAHGRGPAAALSCPSCGSALESKAGMQTCRSCGCVLHVQPEH